MVSSPVQIIAIAPVLRKIPLIDNLSRSSFDFLVNVDSALDTLLEREDTNGDNQITVDDAGPQVRNCLKKCYYYS
jgi:Neutral trehalase Ca2+ binding domain